MFSVEEGFRRADYQRPGVIVVMGPESAYERLLKPLSDYALRELPGPSSWWEYDIKKRLGFIPSYWAYSFAQMLFAFTGREATDDEWRWLHGPADLKSARKWLENEVEKTTGITFPVASNQRITLGDSMRHERRES